MIFAACSGQRSVIATGAGVALDDAPAGTADIAALVQTRARAAEGAHRRLVVYVGASWCEPCRAIHDAAVSHRLDAEFPDLTLLAFDLDRDGAALERAGYTSPLIPLFALPEADGRASARREYGGVKQGDNVALLVGKLHHLLGDR